jgi:segregation and condensation protein B
MEDTENRQAPVAAPGAGEQPETDSSQPPESQEPIVTCPPENQEPVTGNLVQSLTVATEPSAKPEAVEPETRESALTFVAAIERPAEAAEDGETGSAPSLDRIVEALLFAATSPVPESRLRDIAACTAEQLAQTVEHLNQEYEGSSRSFRIHRIAQGYQLYTLPEYSEWVGKLFKSQRVQRLSRASLETLSIVAYKQPVTKPEIEQFRGVDSTAPLATLLERKLVVLAGRAHKPGNPFLYRTSKEFLRYFGLANIEDLPRREELEEFLRHRDLGDEPGEPESSGIGVPPRPAPAPIPGPYDNPVSPAMDESVTPET